MTNPNLIAASLLALAATPALAHDHVKIMGYALADEGSTLVTMADLSMPEEVMTHDLATPVQALAYRPVTGELLAYSAAGVFVIDPVTGDMTDLEAMIIGDAMVADGAMVGFDFNNAIDAVRVVSSAGDNLVYFPDGFGDGDDRAGSLRRFTPLAYADEDANAGAMPMIFANAYTNAIAGMTAGGTLQYALDAATDSLVTLANNDGTLMTVAPITVDGAEVDLSGKGGFEIVSPEEGTDMAYAILQIEGEMSAMLYEIDLETGAATPLADLGMGGVTGFAASLDAM